MRADRPIRLPLQVGTSALFSLARGSAVAVPGIILFTIGLAIVIYVGAQGADLSGDGVAYFIAALLTPGLVTCAFAYQHLKRAAVQRPSDLLVTGEGLEILGGPHRGEKLTWTAITAVQLTTPAKPKKGEWKLDNSDLRVMTIECRDRSFVVAAAETNAEQQSLEDLARTLRAASGNEPPAPDRALTKPVNLLVCAGCGAALAPDDVATVACPYCAHATPVGDALRAQVRDARALEARPDAAIAKLLEQPRAGVVGAMYLLASIFMLVAWPVAVVIMVSDYRAHALTVPGAGFLVGFVLACITGFYALIRGRLVDRQALALVAVDFAAVEPAKPGQPYQCLRCLAPLSEAGADRVLVRCAYCNADNVLGLHIGREASNARHESTSLDDALARRHRERRRWRGVTLVALLLLAAAWVSLWLGVSR